MTKLLADQASDAILRYIRANQLGPGDKLPNEYQLAEDLNVGRSTLREAVRALASRNILEVRQGSGTYLSKNMGVVDDPLGFQFVDDTYQLTLDLFYVRYILEPEVASLASKHRTEEQMKRLSQTQRRLEESIERGDDAHIELDVEFHSIISEMSGNIAMNHLVPVINESISLYNEYYTNEMSKQETISSHREIELSIKKQNALEAKMAMQVHLINIQRQMKRY